MSVIVKDMKMPTGCGSCDFANYFSDGEPYCRRLMRRIVQASKRLDECPLEDAGEDGRIALLPCKVGDFLYEVDLPEYGVIVCEVISTAFVNQRFAMSENGPIISATVTKVVVIGGHGTGSSYDFEAEDFGKTVFYTREEAETALKEKGK